MTVKWEDEESFSNLSPLGSKIVKNSENTEKKSGRQILEIKLRCTYSGDPSLENRHASTIGIYQATYIAILKLLLIQLDDNYHFSGLRYFVILKLFLHLKWFLCHRQLPTIRKHFWLPTNQ